MRYYMRQWRVNNTCECGQGLRIGTDRGCARCEEIDRQNRHADSLSGRILAALSHMDWPMAVDLADAVDESGAATSAALSWLIEQGKIESRWEKGMGMVYRIKQRRAA